MSVYKWTKRGTLLKLPEGVEVVQDSKNADYQAYALWAAGNETLAELPDDAKDVLQGQIEAAERDSMTSRVVREFVLSGLEAQAAAKGQTPAQLAASDPAYRKLNDINERIKAMRAIVRTLP